MEVKIGVQHASRELTLDTDASSDEIEKQVADALAGAGGLLIITDSKGRRVVVPADKLAYVEIGSPTGAQVGFRT